MILTKRMLAQWTESMRVILTEEQKKAILKRFGEEPEPYEWSEQDISAQIDIFLRYGKWEKPIKKNGEWSPEPGMDF